MFLETKPKIGKKTLLIALIILILLGVGWFVYKKQKTPAGPSPEEIIQKQMGELNALRQEAGYKEPTPEEIKKQMEELSKLKGQ